MAFTKLSLAGARDGADPVVAPDVWTVFRAVRDCREDLGLRPGHIHTLQALLSFLRPGQGETVFASNMEICRRVGGIDERTLRRHVDRLVSLGLIRRQDSPNGKRYRVRSSEGQTLSFGLSLAPLLARATEFLSRAQEIETRKRDARFLRQKTLAALSRIEAVAPDHPALPDMRKMLRRKLTVHCYRELLAAAEMLSSGLSTAVDIAETPEMSANDGQTVRHHSMSENKQTDLKAQEAAPEPQTLLGSCPEAETFAEAPLTTWTDITRHARRLAPMIGIHASLYDSISEEIGAKRTAATLFIVLQMGRRIRNLGAYFRSITIGRKKSSFDPVSVLARLGTP